MLYRNISFRGCDFLHRKRIGTKSYTRSNVRLIFIERKRWRNLSRYNSEACLKNSTTYVLERNRYLYRFARTSVFKSIKHWICYLNFVSCSTIDLSRRNSLLQTCCKSCLFLDFNLQFMRKFSNDFSDFIFYVIFYALRGRNSQFNYIQFWRFWRVGQKMTSANQTQGLAHTWESKTRYLYMVALWLWRWKHTTEQFGTRVILKIDTFY